MKVYKHNGTFYYCPVDLTLQIIGGRWKGVVIWNLRNEKKRYSELKRSLVSINDKMLSQVLKELEECGILHREVFNVIPPKVTYGLTAEGKQLLPILQAMSEYGATYAIE